MEFAGRLWMSHQKILLLHRLAPCRVIPRRCSLHTDLLSIHGKISPTYLPQTFLPRRAQTSLPRRAQTSLPCGAQTSLRLPGFGATCRNSNGRHSPLPANNVRGSAFISRSPTAFSAPSNPNNIHTSARLHVLLPPHVWLLLKPVQKLFAIILGRSIRKWWKALPPNKRQLFKETLRRNRWKLSLSAAGFGFLVVLFCFTSLEEVPITGRMRLLVFKREHFDVLTEAIYESTIEEFKDSLLPETDERYQQVQKIVQHLIACNSTLPEMAKIEWTLHVVDLPTINAFALPNGQMFVFSGMLNAVADSDQLAFILCHEMAHVILDHSAEKASVSHLLDFLFMISLAMMWAICPMDSLAVVGHWIQSKLQEYMFERPYSRTLETEADQIGLTLAATACIDVRASSVFWKQMVAMETLGDMPRVPEWLSTHPSHENRAEYLDRIIPKALQLRESSRCPPLDSTDPRVIFERSMKLLLQSSRERGDRATTGDLHPARAAIKAA